MRKFHFRLEGVLRVRRIQQEQTRARLLAANHATALAAARVDQRREYYTTLARPAGVQSYAAVEATLFSLDSAAAAIVWARNEHVVARDAAAECHTAWAETERRVRTLERLREQARAEHAHQARREEDRVADDLATTSYRKRVLST